METNFDPEAVNSGEEEERAAPGNWRGAVVLLGLFVLGALVLVTAAKAETPLQTELSQVSSAKPQTQQQLKAQLRAESRDEP